VDRFGSLNKQINDIDTQDVDKGSHPSNNLSAIDDNGVKSIMQSAARSWRGASGRSLPAA